MQNLILRTFIVLNLVCTLFVSGKFTGPQAVRANEANFEEQADFSNEAMPDSDRFATHFELEE